ncbi:hypothetical protein JYU34_007357 [Plutella xylostella]|uniref:Reticulon-like protein n=1 Tax=Plutella xylostella TaxID=51655 RepID=A0ABQ7QQ85_PLUXY|nr:hypothetical protein JYU34_007357 [Plutella xylostella]
MLSFAKKIVKRLKWNPTKNSDTNIIHNSFLLKIFMGALEEALFWRQSWFTLLCILYVNIVVLTLSYFEVTFLEFVLKLFIFIIMADAFETWLIYKHRTSFLKKLAIQDGSILVNNIIKATTWMEYQLSNFIYLRETNHTKAFLLANIILGLVFIMSQLINGYVLIYCVLMLAFTFHKIAPPVYRVCQKIKQNAESDNEIENLIPDVSEVDLKLLSFEPEPIKDEKQSLDYWKPVDLAADDASDSSDNSSSIVTNLSMEKLPKDVESSDSSDDEYIPLVKQNDQLQSTLEEVQPAGNWGSSAFNVLRNISGAVASVYVAPSASDDKKRKRISSVDSTDGFEMIDKSDLL